VDRTCAVDLVSGLLDDGFEALAEIAVVTPSDGRSVWPAGVDLVDVVTPGSPLGRGACGGDRGA
jgi:hypothetical protein